MIGTNVSHFKIIRRIGQGGMGVVYLAEDERLSRPVAIKLLPSDVLHDEGTLERFRNEIRATSILSHPVICQVFDVGTHNGEPFMVMEYLEGASIRQLLQERSFSTTEILQFAIEIADSLDFAHEHQIIHRDIKPGNIFLSDRNRPKLLDFGLAKISAELFQSSDIDADTETKTLVVEHATGSGVTMGTVLYMSPEQARGETLDSRTDLFSLGAVIYEMATNVKPFPGETSALVFDSILNKKPIPPSQIAGTNAGPLDAVILKLLEKNPSHRYQSAKALRAELLRIARDVGLQVSTSRFPVNPTNPKPGKLWLALFAVMALFFTVNLMKSQFWGDDNPFARQQPEILTDDTTVVPRQHSIIPLTTDAGKEDTPTVSPDGGRVAYSSSGSDGKNTDIYIKLTRGGPPLQLTSDPKADIYPCWSPDSSKIAFIRLGDNSRELVVVPSLGGTPESVLIHQDGDQAIVSGLSWLADSQHVVFEQWVSDFNSTIAIVNVLTQEIQTLIDVPQAGGRHYSASVSPNGEYLAYVKDEGVGKGFIYIFDFKNEVTQKVTTDSGYISGITWTPDSEKIIYSYTSGGPSVLYAVGIKGGTPKGVPGVGPGATFPSMASDASVLAYVTNQSSQDIWKFNVIPQNGGLEKPGTNHLNSGLNDFDLLFSPDESRVSFISDRSGSSEVWTANADASNPIKITNIGDGYVLNPKWSPDSSKLMFTSTFAGAIDVYAVPVIGGALQDVSGSEMTNCLIGTWASDGTSAYYMSQGSIWKRNLESGEAVEIVRGGWQAVEVPKENMLYYSRLKEQGNWVIYKRSLDETDPEMPGQLVTEKFTMPMPVNWLLRGKGIFFLGNDTNQSVGVSKTFYFYNFETDNVEALGLIENLPELYHVFEMNQAGTQLFVPQVIDENLDIIVIEQLPAT
ncbi:MAG: protein kinase [Planctomycetaceae bacterium]